ncbi:TIGR01777 family oxidoreductase [Jeotgalibacillus proteolyticus]|uniref:TIGR01777 family protein n=1 Tax=Jeotgalibacillus proteolyticus TaxID=2082395 RepID=A0A2S5G780_9BACL|nr:TIGR01777 family oxidoreductase [Jeotgalibacillus proteolyticus]PPA68839.1 TIGR01777 family protein [Jeotgalibacillus proteolyticus]
MNVLLSGGTGFLGQAVTNLLTENNHHVYILTRNPDKYKNKPLVSYIEWLTDSAAPESDLPDLDAVINLAGESINNGRWNDTQKKKIYDSRMEATEEILRIIRSLDSTPSVLVNASAVGYYPPSETKIYTEQSSERGEGFLAQTCVDWEKKALLAQDEGVRVTCARFGIILGKKDGALPSMALPYKLMAGGTVASGRQWLSWIHHKDAAKAILFAIEEDSLEGPFNVTAPNPMRMKEFGQTLGKVLNRPHWIPAPGFALKLALGDKSALVLEGQKVLPKVLQEKGFEFEYPALHDALYAIYS